MSDNNTFTPAADIYVNDDGVWAWRLSRSTAITLAGFALSFFLLLWIGHYTDVDLLLADAMYDANAHTFPWRHAWLTEVFGHLVLKRAFIAVALLFIGLAAWDMASVQVWKSLRKLQIRVVALSAILVPAAISILKQASSSHCPWDLDRYGGSEPYVRLLEATPFGISSGNCMPAGHASSALWLISLAVFFYPQRPRAAAATAGLMLWVGFSVGWMQQLRGAHFLTHTLWSMWIACAIIFGVFTALNRRASFRRIGARENCS